VWVGVGGGGMTISFCLSYLRKRFHDVNYFNC